MIATLTSKGQITIPKAIRERLGLKEGDQLDFDETASVLLARRVVDVAQWQNALAGWRDHTAQQLSGHPWGEASSATVVDDLRGGPADPASP